MRCPFEAPPGGLCWFFVCFIVWFQSGITFLYILYNSFSCCWFVGFSGFALFGFSTLLALAYVFLLDILMWLTDRFALSRFANSDGRVVDWAVNLAICGIAQPRCRTPNPGCWLLVLSCCRCPGVTRKIDPPGPESTTSEGNPIGYVAGKWLLPFDRFLYL